jgi:hypothetical protein
MRSPWIARRRPARDGWQACDLPGNHEPYKRTIERLAAEMAAAAKEAGVALLAPGVRDVAGVRVIGATLWTDSTTSCRQASREPDSPMARQGRFANIRQRALNDFRWIRTGGRPITPGDVRAWHVRDRAFLDAELARAAEEGCGRW